MSGGGDASVADGGGTRWRNCCRFPDGILESPRKTSHIVAHSHLISLISFRRLACKEEVVKVIETLMGINVWAGVWEGVKP